MKYGETKLIFTGTVNMDDPFNLFKHGHCDNKVDEVVDCACI